MKVLVTGHHGYIGSVMTGILTGAGHAVTGLDTFLYEGCDFGEDAPAVEAIRKDVRNVGPGDLYGFDAVIHLAALSNDPLGYLDESCTFDINHLGSVSLAAAAKAAGVTRFLFASSCSLYGAAGVGLLDESAEFRPITAYGRSKVRAEADLSEMADASFSPTYLRNATAYGVSPRLRADVVVNNLVGTAYLTGEAIIESDGTPWRPLVHVRDIGTAFLAVLEAPRERVHNQAFNVGSTGQNYQIRDIAAAVQEVVPHCSVKYLQGGGPDPRCYRVNCEKLTTVIPGFRAEWTVRKGIEELHAEFVRLRLTRDMFGKYVRLDRVRELLSAGRVNRALRWQPSPVIV
jgi:nucleoside-diphosphate-sugar epimerase